MQDKRNTKKLHELLSILHASFLDINKGLNNLNVIEISMMIESVEKDMRDYFFSQEEKELLELYINLSGICLEFFQIVQIMDNIIINYQGCLGNEMLVSVQNLLKTFSSSIKEFEKINCHIHFFDDYFQIIYQKVEKYYDYISEEHSLHRMYIK